MIEMNYLVLPQPIQALEGDGYVTRLDAGMRGVRTIEAGPFGVVVTTMRGDQLLFTAAGFGTPTYSPSMSAKPAQPAALKFSTPSPTKHQPPKPSKPKKPAKKKPKPSPSAQAMGRAINEAADAALAGLRSEKAKPARKEPANPVPPPPHVAARIAAKDKPPGAPKPDEKPPVEPSTIP